jgi:O-6-methylguanine DNA methyltransferase
MTDLDLSAARRARQLVMDLRDLGTAPAPATLLPATMTALGLGDAYAAIETPLGLAFAAFNASGLSALWHGEDAAAFERAFAAKPGRRLYRVPALPAALAASVARVLAGTARAMAVPFDLRGLTTFEQAVLRKTLEIPRGEIRPYGWVAREIGQPGATRAVGSALGRNPIPLLIPCHRVVRSDGLIGNYALGSAVKRRLLTEEGVDADALEGEARAGARYSGTMTTHIFCFPTCRHARRTLPQYRVNFRSPAEAEAAGYRPCKVCRPAAVSA